MPGEALFRFPVLQSKIQEPPSRFGFPVSIGKAKESTSPGV